MKKQNDRQKTFNEEEILSSELHFIELYTKNADKIRPIRLLLQFYKGHYGLLFLSALCSLIKMIPTWLLPLITARVVNIIVTPGPNAAAELTVCFIVAAIAIAENVLVNIPAVRLFSRASRGVEAGLRGAMIRKLQQLSIGYHTNLESGKIQSKIMRDVEAITDLTNQIMNTILHSAVNGIIAISVIVSSNLTVFIMFLICLPLSVATQWRFWRKIRRQHHLFRKEVEHTASAVYDMEELVPVTRAHALENKEIRKLTSDITEIAEKGNRLDALHGWFSSINWATMNIFQVFCLFFTGWLAMNGEITIGEVTLFQSYFGQLTGNLLALIGLMPAISRGTESIRSIGEILTAGDIEDNSGKEKVRELVGEYSFCDVRFNYDPKARVLNGVDLTVRQGETVALVGESGSGKTTIVNMLIGFYLPDSGQVLVDGRDITKLDLHSYRRFLSVVPQNTILFSGTIAENITYGRPDITPERLDEAIRAARLEGVIASLPDGLNTNVGEHGAKLSGGQRQRIAIARAIIRDPKVIIFDEATSALDTATEREIQAAIDNLTKDRTTFIVAHRLSTIKGADKVAVIREGKCVEFGTYKELVEKQGEFYQLLQAQIQ